MLDSVNALYWKDSTLWIGTSKGIFKWEEGAPRPTGVNVEVRNSSGGRAEKNPANLKVRAIYGIGARLLVGTDEELYQWKDQSSPLEPLALPGIVRERDDDPLGAGIRINVLAGVQAESFGNIFPRRNH